jgi:hypothetical protein
MRPVIGSNIERGNRRPSRSWASPTTVGVVTRQRPSPSGELQRNSEWLRSSRLSKSSFNAASMIAPVRSVCGSARSYPATTNTMLFPATSISCASSGIAPIGSGGTFWFAAVKPRGRSGRSLFRSSKGGYHHPASCTLILNHAFTPLILHKNRMRRRARTGLSGGRSVMSVPTGSTCQEH